MGANTQIVVDGSFFQEREEPDFFQERRNRINGATTESPPAGVVLEWAMAIKVNSRLREGCKG